MKTIYYIRPHLLFAFFTFALCSSNLHAARLKNYQINASGITITIDGRIELFNTVAMLFGHNGMTLSNIPYKKEVLDRFFPFRDHPAVNLLRETWQKGWGVDDPMFFLLYLNHDFTLRDGMNPEIIRKGGGREQLQKLASALRDFCEESDFYSFFNSEEKGFYQEVLHDTHYRFRNFSIVPILERFYGTRQHSYNLIINLNGGYGNFGTIVKNGKQSDLIAIVEANAVSGTLPVFKPDLSLFELIAHEFSHGFVNPILDLHAEELKEYENLYEPISEAMKSQGYFQWQTTVNEQVVRAAVIRIANEFYGTVFTDKTFYKMAIGRRFIYTDAVLEKLDYYEEHRNEFPTFDSYAPLLIKAFSGISDDEITKSQKKTESFRLPSIARIPKANELKYGTATFFILGTHEPDTIAQKSMQDFAEKYRLMLSPEIKTITDDQALQTELEGHDLIVFGTVKGNSFLQKYASLLPVTITTDAVLTNHIIKGEHLQVVTSWVNPFDDQKTMVVYTAQQTCDIRDYNYSPVKDNYNYWVALNTITLDKGNYENYFKVWLPSIFE